MYRGVLHTTEQPFSHALVNLTCDLDFKVEVLVKPLSNNCPLSNSLPSIGTLGKMFEFLSLKCQLGIMPAFFSHVFVKSEIRY